jgi:prevent-host-death family protein
MTIYRFRFCNISIFDSATILFLILQHRSEKPIQTRKVAKIEKSDFTNLVLTTRTITVTEAQKNFSDLINRVFYSREPHTLTRGSRPVARVVPAGKRSTGSDLLDWLATRPKLSKEEGERFACDIKEVRKTINVPF